jgi:hypothetical protein
VTWITPYHTDADFNWPLSPDDKVTIFYERTMGWQLGIADLCKDIPLSGYAILHIVLSYFEMIAKIRALNHTSVDVTPRRIHSKQAFLMSSPTCIMRTLGSGMESWMRCITPPAAGCITQRRLSAPYG